MQIVLQRVLNAQVEIEGETQGKIGRGFLLLIGISNNDTKEIADKMLDKIAKLRIFEDENGKTNLSLEQIHGAVLLVSQFTLYADCRKGNRPSFVNAGEPGLAKEIYNYMVKRSQDIFQYSQSGVFGADMKVSLTNDGPFTLVLNSEALF